MVFKGAPVLVVDGKAGQIRGHHVGGELHPLAAQAQGLGEGQGHGGLAHPGDVLQQDVAPGQNGQQDPGQHLVLAQNGLADLGENAADDLLFCVHRTGPFLCAADHGRPRSHPPGTELCSL